MPVSFSFDHGTYNWITCSRVRLTEVVEGNTVSLGDATTTVVGGTVWFHVPAGGKAEVSLSVQTTSLAEGSNLALLDFHYQDLLWGNGAQSEGTTRVRVE